jgi:hypothetical protein
MASLSEAHLAAGDTARAEPLALRSAEEAGASRFWFAEALASRALARVRQAQGRYGEARALLQGTLDVLAVKQAGFEQAQTLLALAGLAREEGRPDESTAHVDEACRILTGLGLPKQAERARRSP